jgi:16S rRNA (adenine1518-N6/adenine1519-N6)-dimethyltransferase
MSDGLPPLREVIETYGLKATKALGQNFLCDLNLTGKIARTAGDLSNCTVYEIGPGPGGLTRALLMNGAKKVIAVERDPRCLPALADIAAAYPGRLEVIEGDALNFDPRTVTSEPIKIVANLPYNIATPLLIGWLKAGYAESMTLMFQKEVAERIVATEQDKPYGRLSVLCGVLSTAKHAFDINPANFVPPPKIWSSVVHFTPKPAPPPEILKALEQITHDAFGQRRKMLRQSLKAFGKDLLVNAEINPELRAENISIDGFMRMAEVLSKHCPA